MKRISLTALAILSLAFAGAVTTTMTSAGAAGKTKLTLKFDYDSGRYSGQLTTTAKCKARRTLIFKNTPNFGPDTGKTIVLARTTTGPKGKFAFVPKKKPNGGMAWVVAAPKPGCKNVKSPSIYFGP